MAVTIGIMISMVTVALLWGVTNPLMKKGAKGIDKVNSSSLINQFFNDVYFLVTNLNYMVPFLLNQCGSILYVGAMQQTDLSLAVIFVNSLTFVITAITGRFLGEEKLNKSTYLGITLIFLGLSLCSVDKAFS